MLTIGASKGVFGAIFLPRNLWPPHHLHNRFVRWRQAGIWDRIMDQRWSLAYDAAVQMIDTSVVRVHPSEPALRTKTTKTWVAHEGA